MSALSQGDKWVRFLRAYGPIPQANAQEAEHIAKISSKYGCPPIKFTHPAMELIDEQLADARTVKSVVITGIAGDGKSTLMCDVIRKLTGEESVVSGHASIFQTFRLKDAHGGGDLHAIFDVSGWREIEEGGGQLTSQNISTLEAAANHARSGEGTPYLLAVNDGQMHRSFRLLPKNAPSILFEFGEALAEMHATNSTSHPDFPYLGLVDLSRTPNRVLMEKCIEAIIDSREEWKHIESEASVNPLFGKDSPIPTNLRLLQEEHIRERLIELCDLADLAGFHLTTRSLLALLSNILLGHSKAPEGLVRPGTATTEILTSQNRHLGAFHRNLIGSNLKPSMRQKYDIFKCLDLFQIGNETTSDLDDLLIFGRSHPKLHEEFSKSIAQDPHEQRNPGFDALADRYLRGDLDLPEGFHGELVHERRRIFVGLKEDDHARLKLWETTVFKFAKAYLSDIVEPLRRGNNPSRASIRKLVTGLNRTWTGYLVDPQEDHLHLAIGLHLTTAPVSDILLRSLEADGSASCIAIALEHDHPVISIAAPTGEVFSFRLSLQRFEFLMRIEDGAMPSAFSREAYDDFLSLKQCCLRDLNIIGYGGTLRVISVVGNGRLTTNSIDTGGCES